MQCQYVYPRGELMHSRCVNTIDNAAFHYCERHIPKQLFEVEFEDFLQYVCGIDPKKIPATLYGDCFKPLKKYCNDSDTVKREALMDCVCFSLTDKFWDSLDENQSELDPYTY